MKLKRETVEALLFGSTESPRFTQDTPILPDVWISYADKERPGEPNELILTPYQDPTGRDSVTAGTLASALRQLLAMERRHQPGPAGGGHAAPSEADTSPEIAYNQTDVYARIAFEELARLVLPLSRWWNRQCIQAQLDALIRAPQGPERALADALSGNGADLPWATRDGTAQPRRGRRLTREFLWMARIVGTLAAARQKDDADWPPVELPGHPGASPPPRRPTPQELGAYHQEIAHALVQLYNPLPITPAELERRLAELEARDAATPRGAERDVLNDLAARDPAAMTPEEQERLRELKARDEASLDEGEKQTLNDLAALRKLLFNAHGDIRTILVFSASLCRTARPAISRSRAAIKADAAQRLFEVSCRDLVWAVVDCGIDAQHPAFRQRDSRTPEARPWAAIEPTTLVSESRVVATYDFTRFRQLMGSGLSPSVVPKTMPWLKKRLEEGELLAEIVQDLRNALESGRELDWESIGRVLQVPHDQDYQRPQVEHGTHVAGILAADWPGHSSSASLPAAADGGEEASADGDDALDECVPPDEVCFGMCPDLQLYDLRVFDEKGDGDEFNVMAALQFIRYLNAHKDIPVINGVNLSLSIRHDVANFACGRTPICEECERLVGAGIVVVAAAGNEGYLQFMTGKNRPQDVYHSISITDPGNAEGVITVGATHRYEPHTYGVSYFSSRGPTGDGRAKPDLVAPGEKIVAPALESTYKELDGTSMAAPHVSGAAALLIARHRELLGQPARVKRILCESATDLGRERYFQGHGMVDVLRAIQSV